MPTPSYGTLQQFTDAMMGRGVPQIAPVPQGPGQALMRRPPTDLMRQFQNMASEPYPSQTTTTSRSGVSNPMIAMLAALLSSGGSSRITPEQQARDSQQGGYLNNLLGGDPTQQNPAYEQGIPGTSPSGAYQNFPGVNRQVLEMLKGMFSPPDQNIDMKPLTPEIPMEMSKKLMARTRMIDQAGRPGDPLGVAGAREPVWQNTP